MHPYPLLSSTARLADALNMAGLAQTYAQMRARSLFESHQVCADLAGLTLEGPDAYTLYIEINHSEKRPPLAFLKTGLFRDAIALPDDLHLVIRFLCAPTMAAEEFEKPIRYVPKGTKSYPVNTALSAHDKVRLTGLAARVKDIHALRLKYPHDVTLLSAFQDE